MNSTSNDAFYSQSYVIDSAYQTIQFDATSESGYTVYASDMIIGTTLANLDPGVLQAKEIYGGMEYLPTIFSDFGFNSFGLYTCESNASYKSNTLENDAILITGNPGQKIHITTANFSSAALLTLDNDTLIINGNCKITGTLTKIPPPVQRKFKTLHANNYMIDNENPDVKFENTEEGYTAYTSDMFIGDYHDRTDIDSNIITSESVYIGSSYIPTGLIISDEYISCRNIVDGILPIKYGGTGTTKSTGNKNIVFSSNPYFDSTITVNNNVIVVDDSSNIPGYSWSRDKTSGMYQSGMHKIDFTINGANILNIDSNGITINGNCKSSKFVTTADARLITGATDITNCVDIISKLDPKLYTKDDEIESGLIAQDVYLNAPELGHLISISSDASVQDGDWGSTPSSFNYIGLIPYLIQSIKELKANETGKTIPPSIPRKFKTLFANTCMIDNKHPDVKFENTEYGYTAYTSDMFIGDYQDRTDLDSNIITSESVYIGSSYIHSGIVISDEYISCKNIVDGVLPIKYGGTGTTTSTGNKNIVFSANPRFDSTITVNNNVIIANDSSSIPGYSWSRDNKSGMYQSDAYNIDFSINALNKMNINSKGIIINGNCKSSKFITTADARIITDASAITNCVDIISKLEPKLYTKDDEIESGLIAQEIHLNAPELRHLVSLSSDAVLQDGDWGSSLAGINYIGLIPYLIQSIKELKATITILESKIPPIIY